MPATPLPAVVYRSARNAHPKYHLTLECSALDSIRERGGDPAETLLAEPADAQNYYESSPHRACRVCALEQVATHVLPRRAGERVAFASMTGQTPLEESAFTNSGRIRASWSKSKVTEVSISGAERLHRIAAATGYDIASTPAGPAIFGFVPTRAHRFAERNLRTSFSPVVVDTPSAEVVTTAWALMCNQPPEMIAHFGAERYYDDPWELAVLASAAAELS